MKDMLDKILQIEKKYNELGVTLSDPAVTVSYTHLELTTLCLIKLVFLLKTPSPSGPLLKSALNQLKYGDFSPHFNT